MKELRVAPPSAKVQEAFGEGGDRVQHLVLDEVVRNVLSSLPGATAVCVHEGAPSMMNNPSDRVPGLAFRSVGLSPRAHHTLDLAMFRCFCFCCC